MLVFSGLGSVWPTGLGPSRCHGMAVVAAVVLVWCAAVLLLLQPLMLATLDWPFLARAGLLLRADRAGLGGAGTAVPARPDPSGTGGFLPWAWGLNGAFSVVATPLANLIAREAGFSRVLLCAAILYGVALVTFPAMRKRSVWHDIPAPSPAAE